MFSSAVAFNQDISSWDVSGSRNFVSNDKGIQFDSIHLFVWLCIQFECVALERTRTLNQSSFPLFAGVRLKCFLVPPPLIQSSVVGMYPRVLVL
jgi:hypothetical protein